MCDPGHRSNFQVTSVGKNGTLTICCLFPRLLFYCFASFFLLILDFQKKIVLGFVG